MLQWPGSALLDRKDTHRLLTQVGDILMLRAAIIYCGRRRIMDSGSKSIGHAIAYSAWFVPGTQ